MQGKGQDSGPEPRLLRPVLFGCAAFGRLLCTIEGLGVRNTGGGFELGFVVCGPLSTIKDLEKVLGCWRAACHQVPQRVERVREISVAMSDRGVHDRDQLAHLRMGAAKPAALDTIHHMCGIAYCRLPARCLGQHNIEQDTEDTHRGALPCNVEVSHNLFGLRGRGSASTGGTIEDSYKSVALSLLQARRLPSLPERLQQALNKKERLIDRRKPMLRCLSRHAQEEAQDAGPVGIQR